MINTWLQIEGMHCAACAGRLEAAFRQVPGVRAARVSLEPPEASIESDGEVDVAALDFAARSAGNYRVKRPAGPAVGGTEAGTPAIAEHVGEERRGFYPLALIVGYIAGAAALAVFVRGAGTLHAFLNDFMAGFFLVFSFFKLLDLRGFADAYRSYDLLARRSRAWALAYPFVELALGVAYLIQWRPALTNAVTLVVMVVGSAGVLRAVLRKDRVRCACLGTVIKLPMTTVTLVEDVGMAAMAAGMLVWPG